MPKSLKHAVEQKRSAPALTESRGQKTSDLEDCCTSILDSCEIVKLVRINRIIAKDLCRLLHEP